MVRLLKVKVDLMNFSSSRFIEKFRRCKSGGALSASALAHSQRDSMSIGRSSAGTSYLLSLACVVFSLGRSHVAGTVSNFPKHPARLVAPHHLQKDIRYILSTYAYKSLSVAELNTADSLVIASGKLSTRSAVSGPLRTAST